MSTKNWHQLGVITVTSRDGKTYQYESLNEAVRDFNESEIDKMTDHQQFDWEFAFIRGTNFKFWDCLGLRIPVRVIREAYYNLPLMDRKDLRWWHRWYSGRYGRYQFRNGPVPGIRCSRGGGYGYHRSFSTTAEAREISVDAVGDDLDIRIPWRRKNLPNAWDDLARSSYRDKSWKRYRKTQYK